MKIPKNEKPQDLVRMVASWLIILGMLVFGITMLISMVDGIWFSEDRWVIVAAKEHFAAVVGLPLAAVAALFVISVFEITTGQIELDAIGFKFKGASGPIILWVLCFLAISASIKLLW